MAETPAWPLRVRRAASLPHPCPRPLHGPHLTASCRPGFLPNLRPPHRLPQGLFHSLASPCSRLPALPVSPDGTVVWACRAVRQSILRESENVAALKAQSTLWVAPGLLPPRTALSLSARRASGTAGPCTAWSCVVSLAAVFLNGDLPGGASGHLLVLYVCDRHRGRAGRTPQPASPSPYTCFPGAHTVHTCRMWRVGRSESRAERLPEAPSRRLQQDGSRGFSSPDSRSDTEGERQGAAQCPEALIWWGRVPETPHTRPQEQSKGSCPLSPPSRTPRGEPPSRTFFSGVPTPEAPVHVHGWEGLLARSLCPGPASCRSHRR